MNKNYNNELEHYGVLGMKWGVRRYVNKDGTLTAAGKKRYKNDTSEQIERSERRKAKVVKGAKLAGKVALAGLTGAVAVSALTQGHAAGALNLGRSSVNALVGSGLLSDRQMSSLLSQQLSREGTRSLDMRNWNNSSNPYYVPGRSKSEQNLAAEVARFYLDQKRKNS